ncbi:MAG: hypothetical protein N3J91_02975 [Verrucomicrobiae bacterium]|nr:hypothetical protein [Verrucomicrobiae bacterium]
MPSPPKYQAPSPAASRASLNLDALNGWQRTLKKGGIMLQISSRIVAQLVVLHQPPDLSGVEVVLDYSTARAFPGYKLFNQFACPPSLCQPPSGKYSGNNK